MIKKEQLRTDLPPIIHYDDGSVNVVLVFHSEDYYSKDGSNSYIPMWGISNTVYYHLHSELYDGWIEVDCTVGPNGDTKKIIDQRDELLPEEREAVANAERKLMQDLRNNG